MADKYKIISDATYGIFDEKELGITGLDNGIDEYMKATCFELLEYIANKGVMCCMDSDGPYFKVRGEVLTKEQLFENFL